jgi:hypothetical protein
VSCDATCQTCRHWVAYVYQPGEWTVPDEEMLGKGTCEKTRATKRGLVVPDTLAYAEGDSEGYGVLVAFPSFGCNQHEPKETEVAKENH